MKTHLPHLVLTILLMGVLSGFQKNLTTIEIEAMDQTFLNQTGNFPIQNQNPKDIPSLVVKHEINGNLVLIECIVTGISFRETDKSKQKIGKIVVWIDGKKHTESTAAALIIKDLKPGRHKIILEIVNLNNEPFGLANEFMVIIPK